MLRIHVIETFLGVYESSRECFEENFPDIWMISEHFYPLDYPEIYTKSHPSTFAVLLRPPLKLKTCYLGSHLRVIENKF